MTLASIDSLCPACEGSSRLATSHRLNGHHQVVQCSHCRLEFLVPFIRGGMSSGSSSSAVTSPSYIEMMTRDYERLKDRIHQRAMSRLDLYSRLLGGRKPHRILDIGCGPGWLVKAYNEAGVQASGMEILPELIVVARSLGTDVNQGDICEIPDDAEPIYDVITCSQALEHILTPRLAVRNMARLLRPGAILHVDVPNADSWGSRVRRILLLRTRWGAIDIPHHQVGYHRRSLRTLLQDCGLEDLDILERSTDDATYGQVILPTAFPSVALLKLLRPLGHGYLLIGLARKPYTG